MCFSVHWQGNVYGPDCMAAGVWYRFACPFGVGLIGIVIRLRDGPRHSRLGLCMQWLSSVLWDRDSCDRSAGGWEWEWSELLCFFERWLIRQFVSNRYRDTCIQYTRYEHKVHGQDHVGPWRNPPTATTIALWQRGLAISTGTACGISTPRPRRIRLSGDRAL